jgi:CheY-like chemotaxis protein
LFQQYSDANNLQSVDLTATSNCSSKSKSLKILIAEDKTDIAILYKAALKKRNHQPTITTNGEDCLKVYHEDCQSNRFASEQGWWSPQPGLKKIGDNYRHRLFDVVLLDCNLPYINGIDVAEEILAVNPHQRIILL